MKLSHTILLVLTIIQFGQFVRSYKVPDEVDNEDNEDIGDNVDNVDDWDNGDKIKPTIGEPTKKTPCPTKIPKGFYKWLEAKRKRATAFVKKIYKFAKKVNPNMFATTEEEAKKFTNSLMREVIVKPPVTCDRKNLPKYTDCKIKELHDIFKATSCNARGNVRTEIPNTQTRPTPPIQAFADKPVGNTELDDGTEAEGRAPRTRRLAVGNIIQNNGTVTTVRECRDRKTVTVNGNYQLCRICSATTELPENRFPRFLNEVLCDDTDLIALSGEAHCYQNYMFLEFKVDSNNVGPDRLGEWQSYRQRINTFCSCQVLQSSFFIGPLV